MSSEAVLYRERVLATLDTMRTPEKDRLIIGLVDALNPTGAPDYSQDAPDILAAINRLLASLPPRHAIPPPSPSHDRQPLSHYCSLLGQIFRRHRIPSCTHFVLVLFFLSGPIGFARQMA